MSKFFIPILLILSLVGCRIQSKSLDVTIPPVEKPPRKEMPPAEVLETPIVPAAAPKTPCKSGDFGCFLDRLGVVRVDFLEVGAKVTDIKEALGEPDNKTKRVESVATGVISETWIWKKVGISVELSAPDMKADVVNVSAYTITAPCKLKTDRKIGIGSTVDEVLKAYDDSVSFLPTKDQPALVAGSVYSGIFFDFLDGRVSRIFVGSGGE